jgi:hypothetical protein
VDVRVALSTADSNNWTAVIECSRETSPPGGHTFSGEQRTGPIRQRQRQLTEAQVGETAARYEEGATVYELAAEFGCHRVTVAERLVKAGTTMRLQSPLPEVVDEMVRLCESDLSLVSASERVGNGASNVHNVLEAREVLTRDTQGRADSVNRPEAK